MPNTAPSPYRLGSPITVLNPAAAAAAGLALPDFAEAPRSKDPNPRPPTLNPNPPAQPEPQLQPKATLKPDQASQSNNPFARAAAALQVGQAAARGDVLSVAGAEGTVQLTRASTAAALELAAAEDEAARGGGGGGGASFGEECRPYVGELPGLAALGGLGAAAGPAAVLGTDTLRRRARLWVTRTHVYT